MKIYISLVTAVVIFAGTAPAADLQREPSAAKMRAVGINKLSLDLYRQLNHDGENLFFSPLSISAAFGLAHQGAAGDTAVEIAEVLHLPSAQEQAAQMYAALMKSLNERQGKESFELHMANALWVQQGYTMQDSFMKIAKVYFGAQAEQLSFQNQPQKAASRINKWVADKTADKIKDLISPSAINDLTRLVLTNAVYFKGTWQSQFQEGATQTADFSTLNGSSFEVPTMHQTHRFGYVETDDLQMLEMRYEKCGIAMNILLPKAKAGLPDVEAKLDHATLTSLFDDLKPKRVRVALPRFKMQTKYELNAPMQALGMKTAFVPGQADFSGITEREKLFIQAAIHKAYIDVDEKGTEAAAATGLLIQATSAPLQPPTSFNADHPFIFLIRDSQTGVILFMGRVLDPR